MELMPLSTVVEQVQQSPEVEIFNKENPKSVYNLVSPSLRRKLFEDEKRWNGLKDYLEMDEWDLRTVVKPTPLVNRLRLSFWNEYYKAVDENRNMRMGAIYRGVCSSEKFNKLVWNNGAMSWMLTPPVDTVLAMKETLDYGMDRLREILSLPLYKTESVKIGKDEFEDREVVDDKVAALILKAVAMLDLRLHGSYVQVQKVEQKTINLNKNITNNMRTVEGTVSDADVPMLEEDIDKKLRELKLAIQKESQMHATRPITKTEAVVLADNGVDPTHFSQAKHIEEVAEEKLGKFDVEDL